MIVAATENVAAQVFEAAMLVCFGVSWPMAIIKSLRTRRTEGKSFAFLVLVFVGYVAGVTAKCVRAAAEGRPPEMVTLLYALNGLFVAADAMLYIRYSSPRKEEVGQPPPSGGGY